jgi:RNA polymerase sigma factor (sigma-70 family)
VGEGLITSKKMAHISHEKLPATDFESILAAARRGESPAIDCLVERYYPEVQEAVHRDLSRDLRISRPWLTARFSTGDVVQEVFRSLLGNLDRFEGNTESAFCGYLAMIIRNRLIDAIRFHEAAQRDGRRSSDCELALEPDPVRTGPVADIADADLAAHMRSIIETLPERDGLVLRARIEQGTQFAVLAERLGYSSKWAARRAFYAAQSKVLIQLGRHKVD